MENIEGIECSPLEIKYQPYSFEYDEPTVEYSKLVKSLEKLSEQVSEYYAAIANEMYITGCTHLNVGDTQFEDLGDKIRLTFTVELLKKKGNNV